MLWPSGKVSLFWDVGPLLKVVDVGQVGLQLLSAVPCQGGKEGKCELLELSYQGKCLVFKSVTGCFGRLKTSRPGVWAQQVEQRCFLSWSASLKSWPLLSSPVSGKPADDGSPTALPVRRRLLASASAWPSLALSSREGGADTNRWRHLSFTLALTLLFCLFVCFCFSPSFICLFNFFRLSCSGFSFQVSKYTFFFKQ